MVDRGCGGRREGDGNAVGTVSGVVSVSGVWGHRLRLMGELGLETCDLSIGVCFVLDVGGFEFCEGAVDLLEFLELFFEFAVKVTAHEEEGLVFGEGSIVLCFHVGHDGEGTVELRGSIGGLGGGGMAL